MLFRSIQTGVRFLPLSVVSFFIAPLSGRLSSTVPIRALLGVGLALNGVALLLMHGVTSSSQWTTLLAGFVVAGIGIGMVNPPLATTAVSVVPPRQAGMAAGANNTCRQVGIATGIAGLGALFQHSIANRVPPNLVHATSSGLAEHGAFIHGLNEIFVVGAIVAFAGAALAFALVRKRDFVASAPEPA